MPALTPTGQTTTTADQIVFYAMSAREFLEFSGVMRQKWQVTGAPSRVIVWKRNPFVEASFWVGWYYNANKLYEKAIAALDRGLDDVPAEAALASEKAFALSGLNRNQEALQLCDATLASEAFIAKRYRALLLRRKGFALTELGRLVDAVTAYQDSLALDPSSAIATKELAYIRGLSTGRPPTPPRTP